MKINPCYYIAFLLILSSCIKEEEKENENFLAPQKGVFILSEGNYMYGNASISYYDKVEKKIENTIFYRANSIPLGDQAQSIVLRNNRLYVTVCNSGKICVIDANTYKMLGKITELVAPRYIHFFSDEKAYVSDLYSKSIYVINPKSFSIIKKINIDNHSDNLYQHSSEEFIQVGKFVYVNSWSYDDKILVIDSEQDALVDSIEVLAQPRKMVKDKNNKLWVLCDGGYEGSFFVGDKGIVKINPENNSIEKTFYINNSFSVCDLKINGSKDTLYYINNHVYRFSETSSELPNIAFIDSDNRNFYALGIDPVSSDVYVSDAIDYLQKGIIYRYSSNSVLIDSFKCGIIPSSFVFK